VNPKEDRWLYRLGMALNWGGWVLAGLWAAVGLLVALYVVLGL
jgi:hypothetical protein